ncbi:zinc-binding oxidoreductase CipB [Rhexocercosporidium sp. MPI-PUGE-AT-0058]|nr:zinc-binding oxidoreductase CipB [Rhexocercosporidium sp. MPI-PUGE-AT-0058]
MTTNAAAWLMEAKSIPFTIRAAPLATPDADQILIKNHAIAINPIDGKLQYLAIYPVKYPTILGQDVAGEVISVGPGVTRFKPGDRVLGVTTGFATGKDAEKGFQAYTILNINGTSEIPDDVSFENAVVLPLAVSTAASGLFNPDILNLQLPTQPAQPPTSETLLVWGGASSVGSNAIQLAVAAGYEVIATASTKNFEYVKNLGASQVFDYSSSSVIPDLVDAFKGKTSVGLYDAVGGAAWVPAIEFAQKTGTRMVATVTPGFPEAPEGVEIKKVFAPSIMSNHVGKAVFEGFLPKALKSGVYLTAPEPIIAGRGLESIQVGVDLLRKGVSAKKVVVVL